MATKDTFDSAAFVGILRNVGGAKVCVRVNSRSSTCHAVVQSLYIYIIEATLEIKYALHTHPSLSFDRAGSNG